MLSSSGYGWFSKLIQAELWQGLAFSHLGWPGGCSRSRMTLLLGRLLVMLALRWGSLDEARSSMKFDEAKEWMRLVTLESSPTFNHRRPRHDPHNVPRKHPNCTDRTVDLKLNSHRSIEKSNNPTENRTRYLPSCSIVPQPNTLPRTPPFLCTCLGSN
jgi:hypothetical protein